ncbi:MAG: hypothetical protein ACR5K9_10720 [Wolbachia sp.]
MPVAIYEQTFVFTASGVIPACKAGMTLLHSNRKNLAVADKIHYKIAV